MRKLIGAVAMAAFVGLGAVAPPAGAAAGGRVRTVEFTGTSTFEFVAAGCSFVHQTHDATLATRRGATINLDGCVEFPSGTTFPYTGTFTIDIEGRRSIAGTVSGEVGGTPPSSTCPDGLGATGLAFELTPVRDNGRTQAPIQLVGTWCSPGTANVPGPIFGTLTGELPPTMH
jgi:hypothetical protein